jgi:competence protein ComEC
MQSVAAIALLSLAALAAAAPRSTPADRGRQTGPASAAWLCCLAVGAAALGLAIGSARIEAIDAGALDLESGREITATGFVSGVPDRSQGQVSVAIETSAGRLLARAPEPVAELAPGSGVRARGTIRDPGDWEGSRLELRGIRDVLATAAIEPHGGRRGGLWGALDTIRSRAEAALGRGTPESSANLLRGFVLGQDDRIDAATVDDFKGSGLAHLLAVSGQNVVLLAVLAGVVLAALDISLRARLLVLLALIAVYVPVAGAGASIQRAGVMGAAAIVAALAERPRSRAYAVLLALAITLALNPRASADIGWQLSFAAVIGIMVGSAPIAAALSGGSGGWRRGLADATALTLAATLSTAPLMAHHFGTASVVALPANLVALPAVAPVMWLGMLAGALGQFEWLPVEPLTWLAGVFAGYIAQVAGWFAGPSWAQIEVELGPMPALGLSFLVLALGSALVLRWARRSRGLHAGAPAARKRRRTLAALGLAATIAVASSGLPGAGEGATPELRVSVLDVGQGDAILLEPSGSDPVLIDAGPPDAEAAGELADRGIESLAALAVTHPDLDHDGGAAAVLERLAVGRLLGVRLSPTTLGAARASGVEISRIAAGDRLRSGSLRLQVLWPPPGRPAPAGRETNLQSLVLLARVGKFEMLLTGDAEAGEAAVVTGEVDVLKVAHHGSEDAGLPGLLEAADPRLAVVSVGDENPYGHPHPSTLAALAEAGVPVLRTDEFGEISIAVSDHGWSVR